MAVQTERRARTARASECKRARLTSRDAETSSAAAMVCRRAIMASCPSGLNRNLVHRDASGSMMLQGHEHSEHSRAQARKNRTR